jgi:hypothetical protein
MRQYNFVITPAELGIKNDCGGEDLQQITDRPADQMITEVYFDLHLKFLNTGVVESKMNGIHHYLRRMEI